MLATKYAIQWTTREFPQESPIIMHPLLSLHNNLCGDTYTILQSEFIASSGKDYYDKHMILSCMGLLAPCSLHCI